MQKVVPGLGTQLVKGGKGTPLWKRDTTCRTEEKKRHGESQRTLPFHSPGCSKFFCCSVRLLGTMCKAINYISEPGPQEPYRDNFWNTLKIIPVLTNYISEPVLTNSRIPAISIHLQWTRWPTQSIILLTQIYKATPGHEMKSIFEQMTYFCNIRLVSKKCKWFWRGTKPFRPNQGPEFWKKLRQ
jgi:hypothetical protein